MKKWISYSGQRSKNMVVSQTQEKEPGEHSGRRDRSAIVGIWEIALKREDYTDLAGGYYLREAGLFRAFAVADLVGHDNLVCRCSRKPGYAWNFGARNLELTRSLAAYVWPSLST